MCAPVYACECIVHTCGCGCIHRHCEHMCMYTCVCVCGMYYDCPVYALPWVWPHPGTPVAGGTAPTHEASIVFKEGLGQ